MTVQQHILQTLTKCGHYQLTEADRTLIEKEGLESYIFQKIASKQYRKTKLDPACIDRVKHAIHANVHLQKPLPILYFQGGYKLWRFPTSPEVDWAEFFNLAYVLSYIAPIAAAYNPGITLSYYIHTLLPEKHDNLTTKEIEQYITSFQTLINLFLKYTPTNISIRIWKDADLYGRDEYFATLDEVYKEAEKQYEAMTPERKTKYKKLGELNIKWHGQEDWTKLTTSEKEEKIRIGGIWELAGTANLHRIDHTAKGNDKILLMTVSTPQFINIGSTKTSVTKHWTGFGVLEQTENGYNERILSPSQFEKANTLPYTLEPIHIIPLKNFSTIRVYPTPFSFTT